VRTAKGEPSFPILGQEPSERADAARNRERVIAAAERLFEERGFRDVSMDDVAETAGVGKGTVYRRFGDRAGLALALLGRAEALFQQRILTGPPPLGPGAPPEERLVVFLRALAGLVHRYLDLHVMAESGDPVTRFGSAIYAFYREHVRLLIAEIRPELDAACLADALLAPLDAGLMRHAADRDVSLRRMKDALERVARGALAV
jgi:AcrR family transcriptional regulator